MDLTTKPRDFKISNKVIANTWNMDESLKNTNYQNSFTQEELDNVNSLIYIF